MHTKTALRISSSGLGTRDRIVLHTVIRVLARDGFMLEMITGDVHRAHLLVVDEDGVEGRTALEQRRSGQVILLFSSNAKSGKNLVALQKPVEIDTLRDLLKGLFRKMQAQLLCGTTTPGFAPGQSVPEADWPERTLFQILLDAKENKKVIRIRCDSRPDIFVDGLNQSLATTATMETIREVIRMPISQLLVEDLETSSFAVHGNGMTISTLHNVLWVAAIECSRGRLLPGHSPDIPVKLRAWPNFTRNDFKLEHLRLAAVLSRRAVPLRKLAEITQVAYEDIVDFYNAAYAADLVETCKTEQPEAAVSRKTVPQWQGLFGKIARRLSFRN